MPHIHTGQGEHDHTVSAFIIRTDFGEPKLMLHMHKKLHRYIQFGGHIELDETPWATLKHEILEESGYEMMQLKILQPKSRIKRLTTTILHPTPVCYNTHSFNDEHFHTDLDFVFTADAPPSQEVADSESDDLMYVSRSELLSIDSGQIFEDVREIGLFIFDECLPNWEQVDTSEFH